MGDDHPLYGPSPPIMTFLENLRSSPNVVIGSLPRIISYLPLVDSSTWYFHVTILVQLNSGKKQSIFTFFKAVNFPFWVSQIFFAASFYLSFDIRLPITIFELLPMSNIIRKFFNFALPLRLFIQPCSIAE